MPEYKPLPSPDELNELFEYSEGQLIRKTTVNSRAVKGSVVGSPNRDGYLRVKINRQEYFVHRIIWKMHTGEDPPAEYCVDHINRDRKDNRIENLRLATHTENQNNRRPDEGVSYDTRTNQKLTNRWVATLRGKKVGYYVTREEALKARLTALQNDPIRTKLNG